MEKHDISKKITVFRIIDRDTGDAVGSYQRGNYDQYDFYSSTAARNDNCAGLFKDTDKYDIDEYEVTYKLIRSNV